MIFIVVKFETKPEWTDRWPELVAAFTAATRAEEGNLWFEWSRSLDNPAEYVLVEAFRDGDAGGVHVNSDHFKRAMQELPQALTSTPKIINQTIAEMTKPRALPDGTGIRGYGLDIDTGYSSPRGERFTKGKSFGHTGFTGTSFWIDPDNDAFVILLTNSVHPDGKGNVIRLRRKVGTAVAAQ